MSGLVVVGILVAGLFWSLLAYGWLKAELSHRTTLVFAALWIAGMVGFPYLAIGRGAFIAFIALLDVVLLVVVFKLRL